MRKFISFDVGGTNIKYGIVLENGEIIKKDKFKTNPNGNKVLEDLCNVINEAKASESVEGVAFSMPGFIDVKTGELKTAGALFDLYGLNLKEYIESKTGLRTELDNDVNCVALAEKWLGNGVESENFLCMTIGTGIGGAIVMNNKLHRGNGFFAGEFGYMLTAAPFQDNKFNPTLSTTGSVYYAIRKKYAELTGNDLEAISGEEVFARAENNDKQATTVIEEFYKNLAIGIYNLIFIFNPEKVLIGGGISARPELIERIKLNISRLIAANPSLSEINLDDIVEIEKCHFNNDSGLIGALYHFLNIDRD